MLGSGEVSSLLQFEFKEGSTHLSFNTKKWDMANDEELEECVCKFLNFLTSEKNPVLMQISKDYLNNSIASYLSKNKEYEQSDEQSQIDAKEMLLLYYKEELLILLKSFSHYERNENDIAYRKFLIGYFQKFKNLGGKASSSLLNLNHDGSLKSKWKLFLFENEGQFVFQLEKILIPILWEEVVEKKWQNELYLKKRQEKNKPALVLKVYDATNRLFAKNSKIKVVGDEKWVIDSRGDVLAAVSDHALLSIEHLQKNLSILSTIAGHKFIRKLVTDYHQRWVGLENHATGVLDYAGGFRSIAESLGLHSNKDITTVKKILQAGQIFSLNLPGIEVGGLWTWNQISRNQWGQQSVIRITLGDILKPHFLYSLAKRDQILVPITPIPPLIGTRRLHGQQAAYQAAIIHEIVKQRLNISQKGGAILPIELRLEIAARVGLPSVTAKRAWDRWIQDGTDGEKVFVQISKNEEIYHLAQNQTYGEARLSIDDLVSRALIGQKGGRISASQNPRISKR